MTDKEKLDLLDQGSVDGTKGTREASDTIYETIVDDKQCFLDENKKKFWDIKERIGKLKQEKEEKEKLIPEMDSGFVGKICLEKLSKILSREELELIKKGRTKEDLRRIYESTGSFKDELAKKVLDRLKDLDDDEKIAFSDYLCRKRIIFGGFEYHVGYYYTDGLRENIDEVYSVLDILGLQKYVKYIGDLCYDIDDSIIGKAEGKVFESTLDESLLSVKGEIKSIDEEIKKLSFEGVDLLRKMQAVYRYGLPVEYALSVLDWEDSVDGRIVSDFADENKKVYAFLSDYSYYPGGGCGMEYGVKIYVKRGAKTDMKRIVYRDAHSSDYDDWSKAYTKIDKVEVLDDKVLVTVSKGSGTRADTYAFSLEKQEGEVSEKLLSTEEQLKFKEHAEKERKRLLELETRVNGRMPSYHDLVYMQMPNAQGYEMRYDEAEVVDEHMCLGKGVYVIVIKTQIDSRAGDGKQFAWIKYKITPEKTEMMDRDTAWQSELKDGKQIHMDASE